MLLFTGGSITNYAGYTGSELHQLHCEQEDTFTARVECVIITIGNLLAGTTCTVSIYSGGQKLRDNIIGVKNGGT